MKLGMSQIEKVETKPVSSNKKELAEGELDYQSFINYPFSGIKAEFYFTFLETEFVDDDVLTVHSFNGSLKKVRCPKKRRIMTADKDYPAKKVKKGDEFVIYDKYIDCVLCDENKVAKDNGKDEIHRKGSELFIPVFLEKIVQLKRDEEGNITKKKETIQVNQPVLVSFRAGDLYFSSAKGVGNALMENAPDPESDTPEGTLHNHRFCLTYDRLTCLEEVDEATLAERKALEYDFSNLKPKTYEEMLEYQANLEQIKAKMQEPSVKEKFKTLLEPGDNDLPPF